MKRHKTAIAVSLSAIAVIGIILIILFQTGLVGNKKNTDAEKQISEVILQHNEEKYLKGAYACESHHTYLSKEQSDAKSDGALKTYYVLYAYNEYDSKDGKVERISGGCTPAAITFKTSGEKNAELYEFWEPRPGELYASDMEEKFPKGIDLDASVSAEQLDADCNNKAKEYFNGKS